MTNHSKGLIITIFAVLFIIPDSLFIRLLSADIYTIIVWRSFISGSFILLGLCIYHGLNIFNIAVIGVWVGYGVYLIVKRLLPKRKASIALAGAIAGFISVPAAAFGFVVQYALGGNATFSLTSVLTAMIGTHIVIGIGEAFITGLTISAIMASRSDLVHGWKSNETKLLIKEI